MLVRDRKGGNLHPRGSRLRGSFADALEISVPIERRQVQIANADLGGHELVE